MNPNLQRLITSQTNYQRYIGEIKELLKKDANSQSTLRKIILFCKYAFSVNYAQHKKFLCLMLIRDISQTLKSAQFEKILDENIPIKLLKTISQEFVNQGKQSRHQDDQVEYSDKLIRFAVETISFWSKKLSFLPGKSHFAEAYEDLKKMNVQAPKNYEYYKSQKLALGLWGDREQNEQQFIKNQEASPLISQLTSKFNDCKIHIEQKINEAVLNQEQIFLKSVTQKLRGFLLSFFGKYKSLQAEATIDRDVLVVYFHIINTLFKRICNKFYIPVNEMITLTKEIFEGNHSADFTSIDRMDIVNLAGIHKYNALTIFQRIHNKIQIQEAKLGPCELSFDQKDFPSGSHRGVFVNKDKFEDVVEEKRIPRFKR